LARLSTNGKRIVVDESHEMSTEHSEIVISAIHEVLLAARFCACRKLVLETPAGWIFEWN
jgi:hypothetical protein